MERATPAIPSLYESLLENRSIVGLSECQYDCSVMAISVACGIEYHESLELMVRHGFKPDRGAMKCNVLRAIKSLGFCAVSMSAQEFVIQRYPTPKKGKAFITPRQIDRFPSAWEGLPPYLLWGASHVAAVKDRVVQDWSIGRSIHISSVSFVLRKVEELNL